MQLFYAGTDRIESFLYHSKVLPSEAPTPSSAIVHRFQSVLDVGAADAGAEREKGMGTGAGQG